MAWVQGPAAVTASAGTNAATFAGSTPAGNLVVVVVTQLFAANPTRSITNVRDNVDTGVDYSLARSSTTANTRVDIYYKLASSAGTRTVTVTFTGGSADSAIAVNEYDSAHTTAGVTNSNTGTSTSITPGSVTPTGTALYIVGITDETGGTLTGPGGSWNQRQEVESTGTCAISVQDAITSGAQNPTTTMGTSGAWNAAIVTFESARPTITAQPQDATSYEGQTATFTVSATASAGSLSYQWKDDGSNVGTDSNSYTTAAATLADSGSVITCVVTDSNGSTTSDGALWTVLQSGELAFIKA